EKTPPKKIFCDIGMPDQSGVELHAAIIKRFPNFARLFVFVTGGVITPEVADYVITSGCPTPLKPVGREEIAPVIQKSDVQPGEQGAGARRRREAPTVPPKRRDDTMPPEEMDGLEARESTRDDASEAPAPLDARGRPPALRNFRREAAAQKRGRD